MAETLIHVERLLVMTLLLQLIGLGFAVVVDPYIQKKQKRSMLIIIVLVISLIFQNLLGYWLDDRGNSPLMRTVVGIYGYTVRPAILGVFFYIVGTEVKGWLLWGMIALNGLIHMTALFSGICFRITPYNHFVRGPLGYSCHVVSALLLLNLVYVTFKEYSRHKVIETWIPVSNAGLIVVAVLMDTFTGHQEYPISFLTVAVVTSCVFYYIWLHLQFVRRHEQDLMAAQRIQIMMSQIKPHFLYNTLSTIQALCRIEPEKAFDTTGKLGAYLRQNIDAIGEANLIPLSRELEHTRIYAEIEMIRFPNIKVEYHIMDWNVRVPPLSIQPIVENAIRHGVRVRKSGLVVVTVEKKDDRHVITVRDNGKGFDTSSLEEAGKEHIGIRNVRERIERMAKGEMTIESRPGEGTCVVITLPVFGQEEA